MGTNTDRYLRKKRLRELQERRMREINKKLKEKEKK